MHLCVCVSMCGVGVEGVLPDASVSLQGFRHWVSLEARVMMSSEKESNLRLFV